MWQVTDHVVYLAASLEHQGHPIAAAYEDNEIVLETALLQKLHEICYYFSRSATVLFKECRPDEGEDRASDAAQNLNKNPSEAVHGDYHVLLVNLDEVVAGLTPHPNDFNGGVHTWLSHYLSKSCFCIHFARRAN